VFFGSAVVLVASVLVGCWVSDWESGITLDESVLRHVG
jgi:hypothetical protein